MSVVTQGRKSRRDTAGGGTSPLSWLALSLSLSLAPWLVGEMSSVTPPNTTNKWPDE